MDALRLYACGKEEELRTADRALHEQSMVKVTVYGEYVTMATFPLLWFYNWECMDTAILWHAQVQEGSSLPNQSQISLK